MDKIRAVVLSLALLFLISPNTVIAQGNDFATVVNIVRIAPYTIDLASNISTQIQTIDSHNVPANWLITYDIFSDDKAINILKYRENDEIGLWLEVNSKLAKELGLEYEDNLAWHYANQVFLSAYNQEERKQIIDKIFKKFNEEFGYYPKTVGSWWTDAYSLQYMKDSYGVIANVGVADQFSTDHYQVWGQHWSTPFIVNKNHPAFPSTSNEGVVNIQWAPRDPLEGYFSSLYSFQDYKVNPVDRDTDYFQKLVDFYMSDDSVNQITVGLESDLSDNKAYDESSDYSKQIGYVASLQRSGLNATTVSEFTIKYLDVVPDYQYRVLNTDAFGQQVLWYQNAEYRVGIRLNTEKNVIEIFDLRFYDQDYLDPYYYSPNQELNLSVYIPSIIDQFQDDYVWEIPFNKIDLHETEDSLVLMTEDKEIIFYQQGIELSDKKIIPARLINHPQILISGNRITKNEDSYTSEDYIVQGLSSETQYIFKSKKNLFLIVFGLVLILSSYAFLAYKRKYKLILGLCLLLVVSGIYTRSIVIKSYYVSDDELSTLYKLKSLDYGRVLVLDQDCLQCDFSTPLKPAAFSNVRNYVADISSKPLYESSQFNNLTREDIRSYLSDNNIKYIYLVRYEDYREQIPYQPGDLNARLIYSNANTQLWELLN